MDKEAIGLSSPTIIHLFVTRTSEIFVSFVCVHIHAASSYIFMLPAVTHSCCQQLHIHAASSYTFMLPAVTHSCCQQLHIHAASSYTFMLPAVTHSCCQQLHIHAASSYTVTRYVVPFIYRSLCELIVLITNLHSSFTNAASCPLVTFFEVLADLGLNKRLKRNNQGV